MWLALDTSGITSNVAVGTAEKVVAELSVRRKRTHSEQIVPHIETVLRLAGLDRADLTGIAVTSGPGSFTGLRIGLATAKAMAFALQIPLVGVNTMHALMYNYKNAAGSLLSLLDAQKGNVYYSLGRWTDGRLELAIDSRIASLTEAIAAVKDQAEDVICLGEAVELFAPELEAAGLRLAPPYQQVARAAALLDCAAVEWAQRGSDDVFTLVPQYLRKSEAEVLWEKRRKIK
ncbi:MAG: tRNA (adenosine(37)-N6)-threonylcarbamoyltransferase complex dimerization subunit type 1 TsaB [Negativicoccus succinicivorans]|uniref:tRNA (adenosine(37)-N6)-threonylcarbamoyltransferase complex dimerization subunit type 1 TsaB n=1 Tax=Negativicoccus succinicivorans TaxID=620903 RepID=UPI00050FD339|nr:tRNA (adenosine(37)-N6)-threonylcarbamoyltransferase complex dimerization subunit type 1 TsaB [Negativicoccus succinicivorans]KGF12486.1 hypothetical protein HMPREF1633_00085 [Tissierellia bacterium S5-A11]MBS5886912.1 tRNA (adenosine(37)-N6)-threonylcarbamoyltransferase complex dimerization subunit type 1 TsaB [Negativicoccus succinicivorans]MDU5396246.1 tRNA (adenosine(37)-N6)-threonylcarbamoyltransferase complex dimerization subunit type 1 TsaB [Negativicoccus succinicivorans]MDU5914956.1